jgi:hypothetical protein
VETSFSPRIKRIVFSLNQAAAPYTLWTCTGEVWIDNMSVICTANAGAPLTSVSILTDQTTVYSFMSVAEGDITKLLSKANLARAQAATGIKPLLLSGDKILATIAGGASATGVLNISVQWTPTVVGSFLT